MSMVKLTNADSATPGRSCQPRRGTTKLSTVCNFGLTLLTHSMTGLAASVVCHRQISPKFLQRAAMCRVEVQTVMNARNVATRNQHRMPSLRNPRCVAQQEKASQPVSTAHESWRLDL